MKKLPISVCLIVKNEEKFLDACLKSVRDWVNEIIVVDTGSTDSTVEIAKNNGALVYHHKWKNDFAEARNVSLSYATNPWILQLDADEEIIDSTKQWFFDAYPWLTADGYYLELHNLKDGESTEVMLVHKLIRFFRNHPDIRFKFSIHENIIIPSDKIELSKAQILHKGYGFEESNQTKVKRNLETLLRNLEKDPHDPYTLYYLAQTYENDKNYNKACEFALESLKYGATYPIKSHVYRVILNFAQQSNQWTKLMPMVESSLPNDSLFPEIDFYRGIRARMEQRREEALTYFLNFIAFCEHQDNLSRIGEETFIITSSYINALLNAATFKLEAYQFDEAEQLLKKGIKKSPTSIHLYAILAKVYLMKGQKSAAIHILEQVVTVLTTQNINLFQKSLIDKYRLMIKKIQLS